MRYGIFSASKHVTAADVELMCHAIVIAGFRVRTRWGTTEDVLASPCASREDALTRGFRPCAITDEQKDADALGFHDVEQGVPHVFDQVSTVLDGGGGILRGGPKSAVSVLSVLSHEVWETELDPACNLWVQLPDGSLTPLEVSDPAQGIVVPIQLGAELCEVSDAVFPAYYDPDAVGLNATKPGSYDLAGAVGAPFELTPGGYRVVMRGAQVSEEWGDRPDPVHVALAAQRRPRSRASRRGSPGRATSVEAPKSRKAAKPEMVRE